MTTYFLNKSSIKGLYKRGGLRIRFTKQFGENLLWNTVCQKIRGSKNVFTRHVWDNCWIVIVYIWLESSSWAEYKYVKIVQQHFVVVKSQEDEKYALLSQGITVVLIFTDEGLIFANCECITIAMSIWLKSELQTKERDLLTVLRKQWIRKFKIFSCFEFPHVNIICCKIFQMAGNLVRKCILFILLEFNDSKLLLK